MKLQLDLPVKPLASTIQYGQKILLIGSCFTEHISDRLSQHCFDLCSNPNGILFNPLSVAGSLQSYLEGRLYAKDDLFYLHELWNSWDHHTRFSDTDVSRALSKMNTSQQEASGFIAEADWLIVTLGSAFQYYLLSEGRPVANNHRAPGQWFEKHLLTIEAIKEALCDVLEKLWEKNPGLRVIFTISPVRHIRDGVVENNRSKARLIEAVHELCASFAKVEYFPAYELLIDVLRDYRFYDIDLVHPNYAATSYVWEQFSLFAFDASTRALMSEIAEIHTAMHHRPRFPDTEAHKEFCRKYYAKARLLQQLHPRIPMENVLLYFQSRL